MACGKVNSWVCFHLQVQPFFPEEMRHLGLSTSHSCTLSARGHSWWSSVVFGAGRCGSEHKTVLKCGKISSWIESRNPDRFPQAAVWFWTDLSWIQELRSFFNEVPAYSNQETENMGGRRRFIWPEDVREQEAVCIQLVNGKEMEVLAEWGNAWGCVERYDRVAINMLAYGSEFSVFSISFSI